MRIQVQKVLYETPIWLMADDYGKHVRYENDLIIVTFSELANFLRHILLLKLSLIWGKKSQKLKLV